MIRGGTIVGTHVQTVIEERYPWPKQIPLGGWAHVVLFNTMLSDSQSRFGDHQAFVVDIQGHRSRGVCQPN